jgi:hypothetical protein
MNQYYKKLLELEENFYTQSDIYALRNYKTNPINIFNMININYNEIKTISENYYNPKFISNYKQEILFWFIKHSIEYQEKANPLNFLLSKSEYNYYNFIYECIDVLNLIPSNFFVIYYHSYNTANKTAYFNNKVTNNGIDDIFIYKKNKINAIHPSYFNIGFERMDDNFEQIIPRIFKYSLRYSDYPVEFEQYLRKEKIKKLLK